jgi:hypothetical protein
MRYVSDWERLPDVLTHLLAARLPKEEAQAGICQAIADGTIRFRCGPQRHAGRSIISRQLLEGKDVHVPASLKPEDLDWEQSRPMRPWAIRREISRLPGLWHLDWIELSRTDVTKVLCSLGEQSASIEHTSREALPPDKNRPTSVGLDMPGGLDSSSSAGQREYSSGGTRRRGVRPQKFERTKDAMRIEIRQGKLTLAELETMLEKSLSARYAVSRDTARRARNAVLSEFSSA